MMFPRKDIKTIAVFRALQLGDLLCSIPAFRALRAAYPSAHVCVVGMPWMESLVRMFPAYFDEFVWFPGYPGLPEQEVDTYRTMHFLSDMRDRKFDLAIQMQGNGSVVNPMMQLFEAKYNAGYFRKEDYYPGIGFMEYPEGIPEIHRHLSLMNHIGIPSFSDTLEFPVSEKDYDELSAVSLLVTRGKYICVHPGSRGDWRQWPTEYFALMADDCHEMGYDIVLTGTRDEMTIVGKVIEKMKGTPQVAAGKTSMGAMAALMKNSAGLISNCTGVSHIASALEVKSVVISMDGQPERWAPLNKNLHETIDWTKTNDVEIVRQAVQRLFATSA